MQIPHTDRHRKCQRPTTQKTTLGYWAIADGSRTVQTFFGWTPGIPISTEPLWETPGQTPLNLPGNNFHRRWWYRPQDG